ncbi:HD-GYP domain-containing protein [Clostridium sp.]|uniref:HD-GYP domain-containing protein n=1 Tax=Clostridium sp. TaxID=1506 RepID=UPI003A5C7647
MLQHHEKLDGSGYPKKLKGYEISLNSKIVIIADTIDVITCSSYYDEPHDIDIAIKILKNDTKRYSQELITLLEKLLK